MNRPKIQSLFWGVLTVLLFTLPTSAQDQKANFEMAERFTSQNMSKMVGSTRVFPRWIEDTDNSKPSEVTA